MYGSGLRSVGEIPLGCMGEISLGSIGKIPLGSMGEISLGSTGLRVGSRVGRVFGRDPT